MTRSPHTAPRTVTVAVGTYLRPSDLARCLDSLVGQAPPGLDLDVLVVDNDPGASARDVVTGRVGVRYVVEPTPGISAVRNRALAETAGRDVVVFIDDDEEVVDPWLTRLLAASAEHDAPVVAGRVVSPLDGLDDPWIEAGGFFRRRTLPTGTPIGVAATNNLLLDLRRLPDLHFEERYGLTGGGDSHLTRRLHRAGVRMVWCDEAVVLDHVPPARLNRAWVLARARRTANSDVVVGLDLADGPAERFRLRARGVARGLVRVLAGAAARGAAVVTRSVPLDARGAKAVARGRGMLAGSVGSRVVEYARETEQARVH